MDQAIDEYTADLNAPGWQTSRHHTSSSLLCSEVGELQVAEDEEVADFRGEERRSKGPWQSRSPGSQASQGTVASVFP